MNESSWFAKIHDGFTNRIFSNQSAEADDSHYMIPAHSGSSDDMDGSLYLIDYLDASNSPSTRMIQLISAENKSGYQYILAFCKLREAIRTFRIDRIVSAANGRTGEIVDVAEIFSSLLGASTNTIVANEFNRQPRYRSKLRAAARPIFVLLMALARSDTKLTNDEIEVLMEIGKDEAKLVGAPNPEKAGLRFGGMMAAMDPSRTMVIRAVNTIASSTEIRGRIADYMWALSRADGKVTIEEVSVVKEILDAMGGKTIIG